MRSGPRKTNPLMTLARLAPVLFVLLWSTGWVSAKYATFFADPLTFLVVRYGTAVVLVVLFEPGGAAAIGRRLVARGTPTRTTDTRTDTNREA